jgi:hypothetical protein
MSNNIFFEFDDFQNLYINGSTFNIQSNVDNLQVQLNTDIDCVAYIDVSLHYFNNVFSYAVKNPNVTTDISNVIFNGGPEDIYYYVDFKRPYDISNNTFDISDNKYNVSSNTYDNTWYNNFIWFNPAYARCPPKSMRNIEVGIDNDTGNNTNNNDNDITLDNRIVHSAYPINSSIMRRKIKTSTLNNSTMYKDLINDPNNNNYSWELSVLKNDEIYMKYEDIIVIGGKQYYRNCLVIRYLLGGLSKPVGIIPVEYFYPIKLIRNSIELYMYNNNLAGEPFGSQANWTTEIHSTQERIDRVLSSDRLVDEYIRFLSYCLTNSPNNIELIENYYDIQRYISVLCSSDVSGVIMNRLKDKLIDLDVSTNTIQTGRAGPDASGNYYTNNLYDPESNITRNLLIQSSSLGRGYEITADDILNGKRVPFKFMVGDKITFTFTINPPEYTQTTDASYNIQGWRDFQEVLIKPRKYRIFVNMIN